MRWFERPFLALTPARPYRCLACGRRYWARRSSSDANGRTPVEPDPVVADRGGQEAGRRTEDAEQVIPTDWTELGTTINGNESAQGVSLKDVVQLSEAGIGEAVLIKLIEMDDTLHSLTPGWLSTLKGAGVSDRVLLSLIRREGSADADRRAAAQQNRQSVDESSEQLSHDDAYPVPAGRHSQRSGTRARARASRAGARN